MKPLILLVEDDPNILKYLKITLEYNKCRVVMAENGKEALKVLSELKERPDLIISDIMMPEMDGYDFFDAASNNPVYCDIPFIFLSALDSPEDIRLGKILGADDYLTKPINEADLLAIIAGKIKRNKTISLINKKINEIFASQKGEKDDIPEKRMDIMILIAVEWDDREGPKLVNQFPKDINLDFSLREISNQLYDVISTIFGQGYISPEGLLLNVKNFNLKSYVYFDSYPDESYRGGKKDFMLSLIATRITYLQSLTIKQVFMELSSLYKKQEKWDIEFFWKEFASILKTYQPSSVLVNSN